MKSSPCISFWENDSWWEIYIDENDEQRLRLDDDWQDLQFDFSNAARSVLWDGFHAAKQNGFFSGDASLFRIYITISFYWHFTMMVEGKISDHIICLRSADFAFDASYIHYRSCFSASLQAFRLNYAI